MFFSQDSRTVALLDMDTFFVSVERLRNSRLEGLPVIIGSLSDRGVVAACSYETRLFGVRSAMPMRMALRLCPEARVIRGDMDLYSRYSRTVTDIIAEKAPVYEKASIDEHYLDLSGMDRFVGSLKWARELRRRIMRETGLPLSMGFSVNKTVSKIAAGTAKPNGEKEVPRDGVRPFLDPMSIRKIPMVGPKTEQLLLSMGVQTIATLCRIPPEMMEKLLGKPGIEIWRRAHGIDLRPVVPYSEELSMGTERTFMSDTLDMALLRQQLSAMVERLAFRLRSRQKLTSVVTVKIRYANFDTHTLQQKIAYTAFDHLLLETARALFDRLYSRRMRIRLLGVKLSGLIGGVQQLSLFEDHAERASLCRSVDSLRNRYGVEVVRRASSILPVGADNQGEGSDPDPYGEG